MGGGARRAAQSSEEEDSEAFVPLVRFGGGGYAGILFFPSATGIYSRHACGGPGGVRGIFGMAGALDNRRGEDIAARGAAMAGGRDA